AYTLQDRRVPVRIKDGVVKTFGPVEVNDLTTDSAGQVWFVHGRSVGVFREGQFCELATAPKGIVGLARSGQGIWFFAVSELFRFEEGKKIERYARFPENWNPSFLFEDRSGTLWAASMVGLFRLEGKEFKRVYTSQPEISALMEDHEG